MKIILKKYKSQWFRAENTLSSELGDLNSVPVQPSAGYFSLGLSSHIK